MPTVLDATVVASAYATSASARPQRLSNGWLIASEFDATNKIIYLHKSINNGVSWTQLCFIQNATQVQSSFSLTFKGTDVYLLCVPNNNVNVWFYKIDAVNVTNINIFANYSSSVESVAQTAVGNMDITINEAKTELHATWASKNSTYVNSFNIRYAKGTIATDGSVTWGAVEQITDRNTAGSDHLTPSIVIDSNNKVSILSTYNGMYVLCISQNNTPAVTFSVKSGSGFGASVLHNSTLSSYAQSFPSAIFVPQSVNGLVNGRIWAAWHGSDATNQSPYNHIRVSYSDDGGVTWSAMEKLTSGVNINAYPSITINKSNKIFIVFDAQTTSNWGVKQISFDGTSWSSVSEIANNVSSGAGSLPSALHDANLNFTNPLFIYKSSTNAKVGFYGTWITTELTMTQKSFPALEWTISGEQPTHVALDINGVEKYRDNTPDASYTYELNLTDLNMGDNEVIIHAGDDNEVVLNVNVAYDTYPETQLTASSSTPKSEVKLTLTRPDAQAQSRLYKILGGFGS
jgi:hypothetical protein